MHLFFWYQIIDIFECKDSCVVVCFFFFMVLKAFITFLNDIGTEKIFLNKNLTQRILKICYKPEHHMIDKRSFVFNDIFHIAGALLCL